MTLPRTAGDSLRTSPLPLEPDDSRRNRGLTAPGGAAAGAPAVPVPRDGSGPAGGGPAGQGHRREVGSPRTPLIPPMPSAGPARPPTADPAAFPGSGARVVGHQDTVRKDEI
jgi:two-component system sensor histidine kinase MtrB